LEARGIVKNFGRVRALRGANFTVLTGEVVALVGDNGAGKSTLVKTLAGVHRPDDGEIRFDGQPVQIGSPLEARALGIETVYQDLALAADLDPAANLFMGREVLRGGLLGKLGVLDKREMHRRAGEAFKTLGIGLQDSTAPVATRLRTRSATPSGVGSNSSCQSNITTVPSRRIGRSAKNSATGRSPAASAACQSSLPASVYTGRRSSNPATASTIARATRVSSSAIM